MGFTTAIQTCFRKYVTFSGRASRPEHWWFFLFVLLGGAAAAVIDAGLFGTPSDETGPLNLVFSLATFLPLLAAGWRRMHDTGRSGLFLFYPLLVMIGIGSFAAMTGAAARLDDPSTLFNDIVGLILAVALVVFILSPFIVLWWLTRPSEPGTNDYGPNPLEVTR